jgi:hypothetical protein
MGLRIKPEGFQDAINLGILVALSTTGWSADMAK